MTDESRLVRAVRRVPQDRADRIARALVVALLGYSACYIANDVHHMNARLEQMTNLATACFGGVPMPQRPE